VLFSNRNFSTQAVTIQQQRHRLMAISKQSLTTLTTITTILLYV